MLTPHEIMSYVRMVLRWWWVLVLAVALAAGMALLITARQPKTYVARTTLMVGEALNSPTPDASLIGISGALASFYAEMAHREPILDPVVERLGLGYNWQVIANVMLSTSVNRQASLLDLTVTDTSPERAAAIASAIADELVRYTPNSPEKVAAQRQLIEEQLSQAQGNLTILDQSIQEARAQMEVSSGASDLREARTRLEELERTRDSSQENYNQMLRLQNSSVVNSLRVIEPAQVPSSPLPSKRNLTVAMAGAGGLALGLVAIFLLDMLDTRWRGSGDLSTRMGLNFLGTVPGSRPMIAMNPQSAQFRELAVREAHTQIVLSVAQEDKHTFMISSTRPSLERSAFSIDLAQLFTRSGYRVLLVDADTEMPNLSRLIGELDPIEQPVVIVEGEAEFWSRLRSTPMKNVMLLAHHVDANGRPLPPSLPWPALVESLGRAADVIIFDGPSALAGVDAALLAPLVDGVVLTVNSKRDSRDDLLQSKTRLSRRSDSRLLGAVMMVDDAEYSRHHVGELPPPVQPHLLTKNDDDPATSDATIERVIITPAEDGGAEDRPADELEAQAHINLPVVVEPGQRSRSRRGRS